MKIEFLNDISSGGRFKTVVSDRLIRLFDFDSIEAKKFQMTIEKLTTDGKEINLEDLSFIESLNCSLSLTIGDNDVGIGWTNEAKFICKLTKESYKEMILLIQPFVDNESEGYQWLYGGDTDVDFLFSPGGTW
jgi:hypothetical protein